MHTTEFIIENGTLNILWDFEIETDHLILAKKKKNLVGVNKKKRTCRIVDVVVPADYWGKIKRKWKER